MTLTVRRRQTSSDVHDIDCKEKTSICETLAQATQTSASMIHSYVSNKVFDAFCVDISSFENVWMMLLII